MVNQLNIGGDNALEAVKWTPFLGPGVKLEDGRSV
jgi:hypothetical protein